MIKVLIASLLVAFCGQPSLVNASFDKQQSHLDLINDALWWFPENTETLIVTRGPFKPMAIDEKSPPRGFTRILQQISFHHFLVLRDGKFYQQILGQTVLLSLQASRRFRSPTRLGGMLYEGCTAIYFDQDFAAIKESLARSIRAGAKEIQDISGYQVMMFEEKLENDKWRIYLTFPRQDLLLCATDQGFLRETLDRMNTRGQRRALPEHFPEWKYIDVQATFWAVRHYDRSDFALDPSSPLSGEKRPYNVPDKEAIGLACSFDPGRANQVTIKYLTSNKDAKRLAREYWDPPTYELNPEIRVDKEWVVEISFAADSSGRHSIILLLLLGALGHGLYI